MKVFQRIGFLTLVLFFSQNLAAQEDTQENKALLNYYNMELFQWSYSWGGLSLNYQNQSSNPFFGGLKESMQKALALYDDTNQKYLSYRKKTLWGNIFYWSGCAAMLSVPFIFVLSPMEGDNIKQSAWNAYYGLMGGGVAFAFTSIFLLFSGQEDLFDAVNLYNRNRINEYYNH
jgi:hypothetical protein